ncbi:unnamed protein product, partial [Lampetra planeri]
SSHRNDQCHLHLQNTSPQLPWRTRHSALRPVSRRENCTTTKDGTTRARPSIWSLRTTPRLAVSSAQSGPTRIWVRKTSDSTKMRIYLAQLQRGAFVIRRRSAA